MELEGRVLVVLKEAEKYTISKNRWTGLPNLIYERKWPGLCCFEELKFYYDVYCFCGYASKRLRGTTELTGSGRSSKRMKEQLRTSIFVHFRMTSWYLAGRVQIDVRNESG